MGVCSSKRLHENDRIRRNPDGTKRMSQKMGETNFVPLALTQEESTILPPAIQPASPEGPPPSSAFQYPVAKQPQAGAQTFKDEDLAKLIAMGFPEDISVSMLETTAGDADFALAMLLESRQASKSVIDRNSQHEQSAQIQYSANNAFDQRDWENNRLEDHQSSSPRATELDYRLNFEPPKYGFAIKSGAKGHNAIVSECLGDFAKNNVMPSSMLVAVQGVHVVGKSLDEIRVIMKQAMSSNKLVLIRFRAKRQLMRQFKMKGSLRVFIISGQELRHSATHCTINVNRATLAIDHVKASKTPVWNKSVVFHNFFPARCRHGIITVECKKMTGSSIIGKGVFVPPLDLNQLHTDVIEIKDSGDNLIGILAIKCMIVNRVNRYS